MCKLLKSKTIGDKYIVFENGEVFSLYSNKILKPDIVGGYEQVSLSINNEVKRFKVHRLVAQLFIPNPEELPQVNHKDGNKRNNNVSNLEWCDAWYNNKHARDNKLNDVSLSNHERWKDNTFRKRTSKAISIGLKKNEANKGENNPMFKYRIFLHGSKVEKQYARKLTGLAESTFNEAIRNYTLGKKHPLFLRLGLEVKKIR